MPKPRPSDNTMPNATQDVMLSGTVNGKDFEVELLECKINVIAIFLYSIKGIIHAKGKCCHELFNLKFKPV